MVATSNMWLLLSLWDVASAVKEGNFLFYFNLIKFK